MKPVNRYSISLKILYLSIFHLLFLSANSVSVPAAENPLLKPAGSAVQIKPASLERIKNRGKLLVAMYYKDVEPFYFINERDEFTGIDVELIKGFASLLKVSVEFNRSAKTFNDVINKVVNHEADVAISKLGMTFSRAMRIRYTDPYIMLHQGLLVNRVELARQGEGRHEIEVIKNLRGRVGVIANSSYVDNAKARFKSLEVIGYPSWGDVIDAAVEGKVVAAYRDEVEVKKIIRDHPDTAIKFITVVLADAKDPKAMVVAWDDLYLQYLLNFYIRYLDLNLTANKVLDDYTEIVAAIKAKTNLN